MAPFEWVTDALAAGVYHKHSTMEYDIPVTDCDVDELRAAIALWDQRKRELLEAQAASYAFETHYFEPKPIDSIEYAQELYGRYMAMQFDQTMRRLAEESLLFSSTYAREEAYVEKPKPGEVVYWDGPYPPYYGEEEKPC